jgi:twinkle protein
MEENASEPVEVHLPCPDCGSSDALALYDDGHSFCFSCSKLNQHSEVKAEDKRQKIDTGLIEGSFSALTKRGISEETCRRNNYSVAKVGPNPVQVATYRDEHGVPVAQHLRYPGKKFAWIGNSSDVVLFNQHRWPGGKRVVITEGEIDALSVSQAFNNSWPVVSLPSGIQSAEKYLKRSMEWLECFTEIVLWFDADEPGKEGVQKVASLFTPGKVKIVQDTGYKDANELLLAQGVKPVAVAVYNAKVFRPDGIIDGSDLFDLVHKPVESGFKIPYPKLDRMLPTPGTLVRKSRMKRSSAGTSGTTTRIR